MIRIIYMCICLLNLRALHLKNNKSFSFNEIYIFKYDEHIQNQIQFIQIHINEKVVFAFSMNDIH